MNWLELNMNGEYLQGTMVKILDFFLSFINVFFNIYDHI